MHPATCIFLPRIRRDISKMQGEKSERGMDSSSRQSVG